MGGGNLLPAPVQRTRWAPLQGLVGAAIGMAGIQAAGAGGLLQGDQADLATERSGGAAAVGAVIRTVRVRHGQQQLQHFTVRGTGQVIGGLSRPGRRANGFGFGPFTVGLGAGHHRFHLQLLRARAGPHRLEQVQVVLNAARAVHASERWLIATVSGGAVQLVKPG